jgi:uncharacterized surface protein with fasciclin (FAS1) repeats
MTITARRFGLLVGLTALGVVANACGDDDADSGGAVVTTQPVAAATEAPAETASSPATTMAPAETASSPATTMARAGSEAPVTTTAGQATAAADIVDTAVAAGDFKTLVAAVQAAGLEETLHSEGPFTVFAPTDAAFAALPAGTVDTLLADPAGDLTDILTYHVVPGAVAAADVVELDGQAVTTVNGATFTVRVGDDGSVTLTDGAGNEVAVVTTDVQASNGVIHVIDGVLRPA